MERWREQLYLEHGINWKQHKYIKKIPGNPPKYIYPEDLKKKAEATQKRIQKALEAGRSRALKTGDLPTPYSDKQKTAVDVKKYKDMKFTASEMKKIDTIRSNHNKKLRDQGPAAADRYIDTLSKKDQALYFSYNRKQIAADKRR